MIITALEDLPQVTIAEAHQSLTISTADLETAALLDIPVGTPVGELRRQLLDDTRPGILLRPCDLPW